MFSGDEYYSDDITSGPFDELLNSFEDDLDSALDEHDNDRDDITSGIAEDDIDPAEWSEEEWADWEDNLPDRDNPPAP